MATLVRCVHCGAPHRAVSARERFVCSYCKGSNRLESSSHFEELVCPVRKSSSRVRQAVIRDLQLRGLPQLPVKTEASRFLPVWQLISAEGEEFLLPAGSRDHPVASAVRPPAAPLLARDDPELGALAGLPEAPEIPREEAEASGLASFDHGDAPIESIRLLWYAVTPVVVKTRVGSLQGLFLEGAEKLLLEPIPPAASDEPLRAELLLSLIIFFVSCLVWGAQADGWFPRILGLGVVCAGAWLWFRKLLPRRREAQA